MYLNRLLIISLFKTSLYMYAIVCKFLYDDPSILSVSWKYFTYIYIYPLYTYLYTPLHLIRILCNHHAILYTAQADRLILTEY